MKKNIRLIPIDPSFEEWLLKQLLQDPPESTCCEDPSLEFLTMDF